MGKTSVFDAQKQGLWAEALSETVIGGESI